MLIELIAMACASVHGEAKKLKTNPKMAEYNAKVEREKKAKEARQEDFRRHQRAGDTLLGFDPVTGEARWSAPKADTRELTEEEKKAEIKRIMDRFNRNWEAIENGTYR